MNKEHIILKGDIKVSSLERKYIFKLLEKIPKLEKNKVLTAVDPVFGKTYTLLINDGSCRLCSEDGIFYMNSVEITFGGQDE